MPSPSFRNLTPLLNPRSIAVLGASERPGSAGRLVLENLIHLGYTGKLYPVNPTRQTVLDYPCFPSLEALPGPVDMAAVLLSADHALPTLAAMKKTGIPAAWMLASGFAESGPAGRDLQAQVAAFARENDLLLCGPNCIGIANLVDRSATYSVALSQSMKPGCVSAVMQSGAILMGLANSAPFGFRYLISSGNEAVLDTSDYLYHLAGDEGTKVILVFLEGIRDADKFIAAARAAFEKGKPVLAVKVGRSEAAQRAVQAHTGSLAGSDAVLDEVFRQEKVVRLDSLTQLVEAARLFLACDYPAVEGVGLLSLSGGQIGLLSDLAQGMALSFPAFQPETLGELQGILPAYTSITNPLDAWGTGDLEKMYPGCVAAVGRDPGVGLIAMSRDTPPGVAQREIEQSKQVAAAGIRARRETKKPVVVFSNFARGIEPEVDRLLENNGIPYLQGSQEALRAIEAFEQYASYRRQPAAARTEPAEPPAGLASWRERLARRSGSLSEVEGRELLAVYGIRGPKEKEAADVELAVGAAGSIGFPVVMKILSPDIQHKTECGGVKVGLQDAAAVRSAYHEIMQSAHNCKPDARLEGVLVQEMVPPGAVEVILGIARDAAFGPVVVFGSGGILVELVKDSKLRLPPLSRDEALQMIDGTRGSKLLRGFRGRPAADLGALVDALVQVSRIAVDLGDLIAGLDINPLMVLPEGQGVRAVDALVELV